MARGGRNLRPIEPQATPGKLPDVVALVHSVQAILAAERRSTDSTL